MAANNEAVKGRVASIHQAAEQAHSRKPALIHSPTYKVPGRRQAGLINELPRRVLPGNSVAASRRSRKPRGHKKRVGAEIDAPALFPQRVPSERCLLLIVIAFRALAPLPSLRVGIVIVTTAVIPIHTPTITLVVVRPGKSGGHGGGHKHYHERSCSKNFNDTFQTSVLSLS